MPTYTHSMIQGLILLSFGGLFKAHRLFPLPELRVKIARDVYRIPDVSVYSSKPQQEVPDHPPLVVIEILSKDDRHSDLMEKLEEYRLFGVPNIWVIDPVMKKFSIYSELGLQNASSLGLAEYSFELTPADLFSEL